MSEKLNRDLGKAEGQLGMLIDAVKDFGERLGKLEAKVYWMCGGSAVIGAVFAKMDFGAMVSTIAKAAGAG